MPILLQELYHYANRIKKGELGAIACDTILGLVCIGNIKNHQRLAAIKKRSMDKPFLWLISNFIQLATLVQTPLSTKQYQLLNELWPGPTTIILPKNTAIPDELTGGQNTIAVRYPDFIPLNWFIDSINAPILSTSINFEHDIASSTIASIPKKIRSDIDFIWAPYAPYYNKASKIISIVNDKKIVIRD
tara:strand:+ start:304 stop:870 length:567 start_codon:yes stop_codon:yes gene_type:complete